MKGLYALLLFLTFSTHARDITPRFTQYYQQKKVLSSQELDYLGQRVIVLVPGILSEAFDDTDQRSTIDFAFLTQSYFGAQEKQFNELNLKTIKLYPSSKSVTESKEEIARGLEEIKRSGKKAIFMTHSLGGLALLDYLLENQIEWENIDGVIFLQTPFHGSPMASLYLENPYFITYWLGPLLPFFNTGQETIQYLSVKERSHFMRSRQKEINELVGKLKILTVAGVANQHKSLFRPAVDLMATGCVRDPLLKKCLTRKLYQGEFDDSDGMVPLKSSFLPGTARVILQGVDHGESVVDLPFEDLGKGKSAEVLLKLLLEQKKPLW